MTDPIDVWFDTTCRDDILSEIEHRYPNETGGVLMGYWAAQGSDVVIKSVIGPGPDAYHSPCRFRPDVQFQTSEIERAYRESNRTITYLGDWHSHPDGSTGLSRLDKRTLRRMAMYKPGRTPVPLMMIVAGSMDDFQYDVHVLLRRTLARIPYWSFQKGQLLFFN